jgi:putative transposase
MKARYRYRCYPTKSQELALAQLFGCVRRVWNDSLAFCIQQYQQGKNKPSNSDLQKQFITQAKKTREREWLKKVSTIPLQQSLNDLDQAYKNFFKSIKGERKGNRINPPKFKKKRAKQAARFRIGGLKINQHSVYLAKIGKIKTIWSRELPDNPSSVTIIKDAAGRYFLSFVVEINPSPLPKSQETVGIDLGITTFATLSNGEKIVAPKPLKKKLKKLKKLNQNLSRKTKCCKRREKARKRLAKLHAKIKDTRTDFLDKLSSRLINENQVIVLEDLNVSGMVKNRKLARAISDLGWRQFRNLLEAKAEKYGRELKVINRWTPTSQLCPDCRYRIGKLDLSIREWVCLNCGKHWDRDFAASINIKVAGGHSDTLNGRGGRHKTISKVAASNESSIHPEFKQLSLFE